MNWPYGVVSLIVRGQRVYVVHESSDQSKPILFRDRWPTIHFVHDLPTEGETRYKSLESQGAGAGGYTFWYEGNGFGNYMKIVLMFRGQTESIKRDVLEILPPKTKQKPGIKMGAGNDISKAISAVGSTVTPGWSTSYSNLSSIYKDTALQ